MDKLGEKAEAEMNAQVCDLCGWPIEEWQKEKRSSRIRQNELGVAIEHANPADHRPTREPETSGKP